MPNTRKDEITPNPERCQPHLRQPYLPYKAASLGRNAQTFSVNHGTLHPSQMREKRRDTAEHKHFRHLYGSGRVCSDPHPCSRCCAASREFPIYSSLASHATHTAETPTNTNEIRLSLCARISLRMQRTRRKTQRTRPKPDF